MERGGTSDHAGDVDADDDATANPMWLSAPVAVEAIPIYCGDEMEGGNSHRGNMDSGKSMDNISSSSLEITHFLGTTILDANFLARNLQFSLPLKFSSSADNCCILEISSSEHDNPTDMSLREGIDIIVPSVGMKFQDENEVFEFYKNYAYQVGFPVRKRNSRKGEDGVLRYVSFTCSREGHRSSGSNSVLKPQPTMQTGCKARVTACSELSGAWPGIPLHKSFNSAVVEAGGYENITCVEKDCRNFIDKVRQLRLGEGDALAIQAYFTKMQATSPGFFFSIDLDDEARLRNAFWADNRCRQACKEFGDIVTFDTTYLTNKYEMPFAPFVGVNHHGQSTLLGCGLLSNEDTRTFVWLFRTWLECMHSQAPCGIITDQDRAMQNAIEFVFPNTKHRWCLWHILKKLPEKFGGHRHKASIFATIHELVYDVQTCEDFELGWNKMLDDYELVEHAWLTGLYNERSRWVPCFFKTSFWAGMSTTQWSEGINAFFDGYVHSKTSLKQFVEQYERTLRSKVEKEFQADFKSFSQMVPYATRYEMERQLQSVYTIVKFKEFQEQLTEKMYCEVLGCHETYLHTTYDVREDIILNNCMKTKIFKVCVSRDECEFECSCHLFEFRGIVCKHVVTVLIRNQVNLVPEKYILKRWRRDVNRLYMRVPITYDGWISTPDHVRYEKMCIAFAKLADLVAHNDSRSRGIMYWIEIQTNGCSMLKYTSVGSQRLDEVGMCASGIILDPKYTKSKGAPKKLRRKGCLEAGSRNSKTCRKMASNSGTFNTQTDKVPSPFNVQLQFNPYCQLRLMKQNLENLYFNNLNTMSNNNPRQESVWMYAAALQSSLITRGRHTGEHWKSQCRGLKIQTSHQLEEKRKEQAVKKQNLVANPILSPFKFCLRFLIVDSLTRTAFVKTLRPPEPTAAISVNNDVQVDGLPVGQYGNLGILLVIEGKLLSAWFMDWSNFVLRKN
ncbi:protein FAR1-RELATED SEQUENCE 5-like [Olea europaea var. sylvestris]|uniref:protein FAR1-RELATED SEQUENCE 5-like n=1 Tax=Olea europaea var. sylvestris TaxID=158386 RepID=UPI000C1CDE4F|nr:protein FAR1-RELATED SEQUENCE 5-like [Olea europaea var. sylvestris]